MSEKIVAELAQLATDAAYDASVTQVADITTQQAEATTKAAMVAGMPPGLIAVLAMSILGRAVALQAEARETSIAVEWERARQSLDMAFEEMGRAWDDYHK